MDELLSAVAGWLAGPGLGLSLLVVVGWAAGWQGVRRRLSRWGVALVVAYGLFAFIVGVMLPPLEGLLGTVVSRQMVLIAGASALAVGDVVLATIVFSSRYGRDRRAEQ